MDHLTYAIKGGASLDLINDLTKVWDPTAHGTKHLMVALQENRMDICDYLIEYGETHDDNWERSFGAWKAQIPDHVRVLIEFYPIDRLRMVAEKGYCDLTPCLCKIDDVEVCRILVENGANMNGPHRIAGCSMHYPLMCCRNLEVKRYLLEQGANANMVNDDGTGLLFNHHYNPTLEEVNLFLEFGADPNMRGRQDVVPIMSHNQNLDIVRRLVQAGADVNARINTGSTALHMHAVSSIVCNIDANIAYLQCLIELGADVNARNNDGLTPLNMVVSSGLDHAMVFWDIFRKHGAELGMVPVFENCQLHLKLMEMGVEFDFGDQQGLVDALLHGDVDQVKLLGVDHLDQVNMFIQDVEMVQVCQGLGYDERSERPLRYVFTGLDLVNFINQNKIDVVQSLIEHVTLDWWGEHFLKIRAPSVEMLELLNPPINFWHLSSDKLKKQLSKGMSDEEVLSKGCDMCQEIVKIRYQKLEWMKVFMRGHGWFFDLPKHIVPRVISFIV